MPRARTPLAAIVLAAGKGTRMRSKRAKVLHEVAGRPLAFYPVKRALELGASPVVVVVGHQAEAVEASLRAALPDAPLRFALQAEQLGTAHAVRQARRALRGYQGPILILYGDTPLLTTETLRRVAAERARRRAALVVGTVVLDAPGGYGRVLRDARGRPSRIVEARDATETERAVREVNAGLYCVDAGFLWDGLLRVKKGSAQGEFYLTDLVALAHAKGGTAAVQIPVREAAGVNDRAELAQSARVIVGRLAEAFMRAGVTIEDPARFDCSEGVEIAPDAVIEPSVRLLGRTRVGAGTVVGAGSVLTDADVGAGVTLKPYTVIEDARVLPGAVVGPFARIRPASEVGEGAHVGNFVEIKKTRLGAGAKANHLTYLGDAEVGARTNIGAGTITCNYDGTAKHLTRIGPGCFVGSDSILVAPIEIGAGAYVAAGSTLTDTVPAGALALGRSRQVTKEGWVARRNAEAHMKGSPAAEAASRPGKARRAARRAS